MSRSRKQTLVPLNDSIEPSITFELVESDATVDGEHIIAKVQGEFFVPNGVSRNKRFYPKKFWEAVLKKENVQAMFESRMMLGTVGHDLALNEKAVREGMISHFMGGAEINEDGKGIGTAYILNTPAGENLNTLLRAGVKLYVSSRANGTFKKEKVQGMPVVDENTYDLEGWDFVINPGFLEARPELKEELKKTYERYNIEEHQFDEGDEVMGDETTKSIVEHISNENGNLKAQVGKLTDSIEELKETNQTLEDENKHVKGELEKLEEANKIIEAYKELGTLEQIKEKLEKADEDQKVLEAFTELGDTPEYVKSALEEADAFIGAVNETAGGIEKMKESLETLKQYEELGEVEKVTEALEYLENLLDESEKTTKETQAESLAKETGLTKAKVLNLLETYTADSIRDLYNTVKGDDGERYRRNDDDEEGTVREDYNHTEDGHLYRGQKVEEGSLAEKIGKGLIG